MTFRLETERLIMREWRDDDLPAFAAMNADPEVMRYFPSLQTRSESNGLVDRITEHFKEHGFGLWALEEKESQSFIGFTGFLASPIKFISNDEIEVGWRMARAFWRRGFALEAATACIEWFWTNTNRSRIISYTSKINEPSRLLMDKLGLEHQPGLAFDHPKIPQNHPLCRHVVYLKDRPDG